VTSAEGSPESAQAMAINENQEIENVNEESVIVMEVPSYHLELVTKANFAPHVAIITNLFADHLNRHGTMEEYAMTKANIFVGQSGADFLILNSDNEWTKFFLDLSPKAKVLMTRENKIWTDVERVEFAEKWGEHNLQNLLAASLAAEVMGVSREKIKEASLMLDNVKFRQEKVYESSRLAIYNDTAATSPEATIAAINRFGASTHNLILIAGGTDRELDYRAWGKVVGDKIKPENLILLSGSATEKMKKELGKHAYNEYDALGECIKKALEVAEENIGKTAILFSPGAKSFEKFKNEFDRGEKFNTMIGNLKI
jgi:UDP-N-acetylmuramoylalanine--D-glutamate ligase